MRNYFLGRQIYCLPFLFTFLVSCNGNESKEPSKIIPTEKKVIKTFVEDPYFVESADTISDFGPHNITRGILQDKNGNYWFATWEGIIKYDGKVFTNITLKEGLRHFHVFSVLEDKKGNIWFGTIGGGAYKYDGKSYINLTTKDGLSGNSIECMQEDKAGNIWFGTSDGASQYDGKTFTNFTTKDGLKNNYIHSITQDKTGILWLGTDKGVCCYDGRYFVNFMNNLNQPFLNVRSIIEDKKGNIWIASEGEGLCRYDRRSLTTIKSYFTSYLLEDKKGNLWITASEVSDEVTPNFPVNGTKNPNSHGGMVLLKYDPEKNGAGGKEFNKIAVRHEPNDFQIFNIYEDNTGSIWFGTMKGVCKYDPISKGLNYFHL